MECSKAKCIETGVPQDRANILVTNTIEAAKAADLSKVMVWIFDEFTPADEAAVIYPSEDMLKCPFAISVEADLRARNSELSIPPEVCRTITSNAASEATWVGKRNTFSLPLRRKSVVLKISKPTVAKDWWLSPLVASRSGPPSSNDSEMVSLSVSGISSRMAVSSARIPEDPVTEDREFNFPRCC